MDYSYEFDDVTQIIDKDVNNGLRSCAPSKSSKYD